VNCIYCETSLVRYGGGTSWQCCPKCEPAMFKKPVTVNFYEQVLGHTMDMRGAPNR